MLREYHSAINQQEIKEKYEALALEIAKQGLDLAGSERERAKIEVAKTKLGISTQYINQDLLDLYVYGSSSPPPDEEADH